MNMQCAQCPYNAKLTNTDIVSNQNNTYVDIDEHTCTNV